VTRQRNMANDASTSMLYARKRRDPHIKPTCGLYRMLDQFRHATRRTLFVAISGRRRTCTFHGNIAPNELRASGPETIFNLMVRGSFRLFDSFGVWLDSYVGTNDEPYACLSQRERYAAANS
jgi:hypothetical protein